MLYAIECKNICKQYSKKNVLDNVSIKIPKGAIYGFIGKNGAGKTTLMRILGNLTSSNSGEFKILDVNSSSKEINDVRKKCSVIIETPGFYLNKSVYENMVYQCILKGISDYSEITRCLELVKLIGEEKKKVKNLSLGMKQRLGIAMALLGEVEVVILDEPMNGLDPEGMMDIRNIILRLNKEKGITFMISSHLLDELSKIATHFGFIKNGVILKEVSSEEINKLSKGKTIIEVSDTKEAAALFDSMKLAYEVNDNNSITVYDELTIDELGPKLSQKGIKLLYLKKSEESLENFYLEIMNGD